MKNLFKTLTLVTIGLVSFSTRAGVSSATLVKQEQKALKKGIEEQFGGFAYACQAAGTARVAYFKNKTSKTIYLKLYDGKKLSKTDYKLNHRGNVAIKPGKGEGICSGYMKFKWQDKKHGTLASSLSKLSKKSSGYKNLENGFFYTFEEGSSKSIVI